LAALYIRSGRISAAVDLLSRILESYPNDVPSRSRRCEALLTLGRLAEARKDWGILKRSAPEAELVRLQVLFEQAEGRTIPAKQLSGAKFDN